MRVCEGETRGSEAAGRVGLASRAGICHRKAQVGVMLEVGAYTYFNPRFLPIRRETRAERLREQPTVADHQSVVVN